MPVKTALQNCTKPSLALTWIRRKAGVHIRLGEFFDDLLDFDAGEVFHNDECTNGGAYGKIEKHEENGVGEGTIHCGLIIAYS
jgi:hypothetical protein